MICKAYGAVVLWLLGFPDTARQQSVRAIEMSHGISPTSEAVALHFAAMVEQLCRNAPRCREFTERTIAVADQHGLSFWMAGAAIFSGWALVEEGAKGEGLARLRQGIADWRATGSVTYETYYRALLAEVLAGQAQLDEALQVLEESLALVDRTGEKFYEPELYRLRGEVLLLSADQRDPSTRIRAEQDFRHARDLASAQKVRSLELRAAMSLADLSRRFCAERRTDAVSRRLQPLLRRLSKQRS